MALPANRDEKANDVPAPLRRDLAGYYREKALLCTGLAEETVDRETREQWATLADGWTRLAVHQSR
jgi:hypothetical protein